MVSKTQDEQDRMTGDQKSPSSLEAQLNQLNRISVRLRHLGMMAFIFTPASLVSLVATLFVRWSFNGFSAMLAMNILSLILIVSALVAAVMFEINRKEGDALFEEISDELQWEEQLMRYYQKLADAEPTEGRPFADVKIILRSFARAADLPIIPGKFGPAVYVAASLIMLLIQLWLYRYYFL